MSFFEEAINSKWFRLVSSNIQGRISVYNEKYLPERISYPTAPFENILGDYYEGYRTLTKDEKGYCTGVYGGHGALMYFGKDGKYGRLGRGSYNFTGESPEPYFSDKVKKYLLKKETGLKGVKIYNGTINVKTNYSGSRKTTKYIFGKPSTYYQIVYEEGSTFTFDKYPIIPVYKSNATFLYDGVNLAAYLYKNDNTIDSYYFKQGVDKELEKYNIYTEGGYVYQDTIKPVFLSNDYNLFVSKLIPKFYTTNNNDSTMNKAFRIGEIVEKDGYDLKYGYKLLTDLYSKDINRSEGPFNYVVDNSVIIHNKFENDMSSWGDFPNYVLDEKYFYTKEGYKWMKDYAMDFVPRVVVYPISNSEYMKYDDLYIHVCFTVLEGDYIKSYRGIITGDNCNKYLELIGGEAVGYYCHYNTSGAYLSPYYTIDTKKIQYTNCKDLSIQPSILTKSMIYNIKGLCSKIQECDSLDLNSFYSYKFNNDLKYCIEERDYELYQEYINNHNISIDDTRKYTEVDLYYTDFKVLSYYDDLDKGDVITFDNFDEVIKNERVEETSGVIYDTYVNYLVYSYQYKGEDMDTKMANRGHYGPFYTEGYFYNSLDALPFWFFEEEPLMSFPTNPGCMYYEEIAPGSESGIIKSDNVYFPYNDIEKTEDGFKVPQIDIEAGPKTESIKEKIEQLEKEKEEILNDDTLTDEEKEEKIKEIDDKIKEAEKELETEKETSSGGANTKVDVNLGLIVDESKLGDTKLPTNENGEEYIEIEIEVEIVDENGVKRKVKKKIFLVNPRGRNNTQSIDIPLKDLIESYPASKVNISITPTDKDLVDALIPEVDVEISDTNNAITQDENSKKEPEQPIRGYTDSIDLEDFITVRKTKSRKHNAIFGDTLSDLEDFFTVRKTKSRKHRVIWTDTLDLLDEITSKKNEENI